MPDKYDIADPNDPNTLRVPFMFVPHGCKPTPEWLQAHPGWVRIPAVMVPRDPLPDESGPQWNVQLNFPGEPASTAPVVAAAPQADRAASLPVDPPAPAGSNAYEAYVTGGGDPIAVWREMNAVLDDPVSALRNAMAFASPVARAGTPGAAANAEPAPAAVPAPSTREDASQPAPRTDTSGQIDPAAPVLLVDDFGRPVLTLEKQGDPTAPVPLLDDQGRPVLTDAGKPILRPAGLDPHLFVKRGLEDRPILDAMMQSTGEAEKLGSTLYMISELSHFLWAMPWDAQRWGVWPFEKKYLEYRDYATIAIGLYAAAAGIPKDQILSAQNLAARLGSHFSSKEKFGGTYPYLPTANVANTSLGYDLYESGAIKATPSP